MHSFTSLLADLATIYANHIRPADDMPAFTMTTTPTPLAASPRLLDFSHRHGLTWSVPNPVATKSRSTPDPSTRQGDFGLMAGGGNAWFPDHALGAGCAGWAVPSVRALVDEFVAVIGCRANYRITGPGWEQP